MRRIPLLVLIGTLLVAVSVGAWQTSKLAPMLVVTTDSSDNLKIVDAGACSGTGQQKIFANTFLSTDSSGLLKTCGASAGTSAPADATYITQTANATLTNDQALGSLATGILGSTTTTGVVNSSSTGATDNAVLRADGTGGSTLQSSGFTIGDGITASLTFTGGAFNTLDLGSFGGLSAGGGEIITKRSSNMTIFTDDTTHPVDIGGSQWRFLANGDVGLKRPAAGVAQVTDGSTGYGSLRLGDSKLLLRNPADSFQYTIAGSAITADRTLTLPLTTQTETLAVVPQVGVTGTASPTGTTSTTGVMMGLAGAITPRVGGRVLIIVTGVAANNTIADGASIQIRYGTGTAPTNGAALTGSTLGLLKNFVAETAAGKNGFGASYVVTGLTVGTAYWIDLSLKAVTGGTATIFDVDIVAIEL